MKDSCIYLMTREQLEEYRVTAMNLAYHYTSLANIYANDLACATARLRELGADPDKVR